MKRVKTLIAIIISVFFVAGLSGCGLISKTPEGKLKTTVASVNGEKITLGEYQKILDQQVAQYEQMYGADIFTQQPDELTTVKTQLLDALVKQKLLLQKAAEMKITIDENTLNSTVNKDIKDTIKQVGGQKVFDERLKQAKLTEAGYRNLYKKQLKEQDTIQKLTDTITKGASVTDQEITNYYYTNQYNYTEKPNTMKVSHILLKTLPEAQKVLKEIKAGMKFEDAAKKYGTDGTKTTGGSLGEIEYTNTDYDKTFMTYAIAQPTGKVSEPVQTQYGYHLIKVTSRHEYKLKPLNSVKAEIKQTLLSDKKNEMFNTKYTEWESKAKIKKYTDRI